MSNTTSMATTKIDTITDTFGRTAYRDTNACEKRIIRSEQVAAVADGMIVSQSGRYHDSRTCRVG